MGKGEKKGAGKGGRSKGGGGAPRGKGGPPPKPLTKNGIFRVKCGKKKGGRGGGAQKKNFGGWFFFGKKKKTPRGRGQLFFFTPQINSKGGDFCPKFFPKNRVNLFSYFGEKILGVHLSWMFHFFFSK